MECHILDPVHENYEFISERVMASEHIDVRTFVFIQHCPGLRCHLDHICHPRNEEGVVQYRADIEIAKSGT